MMEVAVWRGVRALLLDLDGTLYDPARHEAWLREVDRVTGERVRHRYGLADPQEAFERLVADARAHGMRSKSEALLRLHGVGLAEMNRWRERHTRIDGLLSADRRVPGALARLGSRYRLLLATNNTPRLARRVLDALEIPLTLFEGILSAEEAGAAKPAPRFFEVALRRLGLPPREVVSVGDRPLSDLDPARALGCAVWHVGGIEDLLRLAAAIEEAET